MTPIAREIRFTAPAYRHWPGHNARPQCGPAIEAARRAGAAGDADGDAVANAWAYGLWLIARGYHWEAHEVLEPVWLAQAPNSRARHLVQGFIQLANACLKADMGQGKAAGRLIAMACDCFADAATHSNRTVMGLDANAVCTFAERIRDVMADDTERAFALRAIDQLISTHEHPLCAKESDA